MAKNFLRKSVLALVLLSAATAAFAQRRTVKGVVTDDSGPLVGVTVVLRDPPRPVPQRGWTAPMRSLCPMTMPFSSFPM